MLPNKLNLTPSATAKNEINKPLNTYKIDFENGRITKKINGIEAVEQFVNKVLKTPRFVYYIYSSNYGTDILDLIGKSFDYVKTVIKSYLDDTLLIDNRIKKIEILNIEKVSSDSLFISFNINTIYGKTIIEWVV